MRRRFMTDKEIELCTFSADLDEVEQSVAKICDAYRAKKRLEDTGRNDLDIISSQPHADCVFMLGRLFGGLLRTIFTPNHMQDTIKAYIIFMTTFDQDHRMDEVLHYMLDDIKYRIEQNDKIDKTG